MTIVLTEGRRRGGFLVSESEGTRSREIGHFVNAGTVDIVLPAGLVLGQLTADSSFAGYTNTGTLGLQAAVGVLWDNVPIPTSGTVTAAYIARDAEVNAAELQYASGVVIADKTAAIADLRTLGIIAR